MDKLYSFPCEEERDKDSFESGVELIYNRMLDDTSKIIFANRVLYSLTGDWRYMRKMLLETGVGLEFSNILQQYSQRPIYIYGAGIKGTRLVNIFPEKNWAGYIDKQKRGTCNGLPICSPDEFGVRNDAIILISNLVKPYLIKEELTARGIDEKNILILNEFDKAIGEGQYFDDECLEGVCDFRLYFVDVGCFDGADTKKYIEWCGDKNAPVMAFEADLKNFELCREALKCYNNVTVCNCGLSDKNETKKFKMMMSQSSKFSEDGDIEVEAKTLDSVMEEKRIGFIKMDVEGYEEKCLLGAKTIISEQHPVLAISIYHKRTDIWKLPQIILEMNPNYRFYLRHYTVGITDTVLYAIDESVLQKANEGKKVDRDR